MVIGNNKPNLRAVDEAIKRRMHLIPFTVQIPEAQRDNHLAEKLKAEWPQILGWMIQGCLEWQKGGLQPPQAVLAATEEYLASEDSFALWREECTKPDPKNFESSAALFASWKSWAEKAGEFVGTQKAFGQQLANEGCKSTKHCGERGYIGLKLRDLAEEAQEILAKQGLV
jgi:putative DNA primase/helicase